MYTFGREKTEDITRKRGFTLVYAVLISSLVLAIGLAIINITIKELQLASVASESQQAFYSADTGWECAIYYDFQDETFFDQSNPDPDPSLQVNCAGSGRPVAYEGVVDGIHTWRFEINEGNVCAGVTVEKFGSDPEATTITSDGFNTCGGTRQRVQRTIEVDY